MMPLRGRPSQMVSGTSTYPPSLADVCISEPPAGQLRLASEATTNFTTGLLTAVAKLSPSTLFSTGGDELNVKCYPDDEETQASLNATGKTLEQALDTFTQTTHKALIAEGKTPVVWEGALSPSYLGHYHSFTVDRDGSRSQRYAEPRHPRIVSTSCSTSLY